ncbi:MAG: hypothetical protein ACE5G0_21315 [Rhodothermales bacterium]
MADPHPLQTHLAADDAEQEAQWGRLQTWVKERFGKEPGIEEILFLIGVQSLGRGFEPHLDKETKQALIMEGTYCAFATLGIYERVGMEDNGHWIWDRRIAPPPDLSVDEQEKLLRAAILRYFETILNASDSHEA